MKYSKQEMKNLSWLPAMELKDLTLVEISKKIKFSNLRKLRKFLEEKELDYKRNG